MHDAHYYSNSEMHDLMDKCKTSHTNTAIDWVIHTPIEHIDTAYERHGVWVEKIHVVAVLKSRLERRKSALMKNDTLKCNE